jgi:threonine/homoserine/homoserine lactone efflux protein
MTEALVTVLPLALVVAVFPVPVVAAVLLVGSKRGRAKCLVFVLAWFLGLGLVSAIGLLLADGADATDGDAPATWVALLLLITGGAFLVAALAKWRGRPRRGEEPSMPGWMRSIDELTLAKAGLTGFALTALNPKNVALAVAAAAEIAAFGLHVEEQIAVAFAFVVVASLGVLSPLVVAVAAGSRSHAVLDRLEGWLARNNAVVMSVLLAAVAVKLIADAVKGFTE